MQIVSLSLTEEQKAFVERVIASRRYDTEAEVLQTAFQKWQHWETKQQEKLESMDRAIQDGLNSGFVEGSTDEVFARVRASARVPRQVA